VEGCDALLRGIALARVPIRRASWPEVLRGVGDASVLAIAASAVASVIPLRGHALAHLAGGPAIATTAWVLLVGRPSWHVVRPRAHRPLVRIGAITQAFAPKAVAH
jgi:peptidoglycan/LPS O-acetylase OafA/YrhL